jgi:hypothetical protein
MCDQSTYCVQIFALHESSPLEGSRAMEYATSAAKRAIVAVERFVELTVFHAWESISHKAESPGDWRNTVPEGEYGGGDICSLDEATPTEDDQPLE